jgi:hypothetical protein
MNSKFAIKLRAAGLIAITRPQILPCSTATPAAATRIPSTTWAQPHPVMSLDVPLETDVEWDGHPRRVMLERRARRSMSRTAAKVLIIRRVR